MHSYSGTLDLHTSTSISLVCKAYIKKLFLASQHLSKGQRYFVTDMLKFGDAKISNTFWVLEISNILFFLGGGGER